MIHPIRSSKLITFVLLASMLFACSRLIPPLPEDQDVLDGPLNGLSEEQNNRFINGDLAFNDDIFTGSTGLGPAFVSNSCGSCHAGDGKGHPSTSLIRFGQLQPNTEPNRLIGGPQLQNRAIPGFEPETLPTGVPFMLIMPPAITGLGFLAALTDDQLLANADPQDMNADGISGVPNYINAPAYFEPLWLHNELNGQYIGRFGKKAAAIDLLHQTVSAYHQDMGITSVFEPHDPVSGHLTEPEVNESVIFDVVFYLRTLKAPIPRNQDDPVVQTGKQLFLDINCSACHIPEWTSPSSDIAALSNKTFYPYTDLLLHDMGSTLDDGVTESSAETYEWRTPPLWGLGLAPNSQGGRYFLMHDGRASGIEEAILLHGGEAEGSVNKYKLLSASEKDALIAFLKSL